MTLAELAESLGTTVFTMYEFAPDHFPRDFGPSDVVAEADVAAITEAWQQDCRC